MQRWMNKAGNKVVHKTTMAATLIALAAMSTLSVAQTPPPADAPVSAPVSASGPQGRWITESGNLEVEIAPCGDALCGTVVRVIANRSMSGSGDMAPADTRPALGMQILSALHPSGEGALSGQIYNREKAKNYSVQVTLDGPQQLLVRGYVGLPLFGKTQLWRRAEAAAGPR